MPALISEAELEGLQRKVRGATRERMLREMAEVVEALTAETPLVLVLEDLQWSDYSTLDLLSYLAQRRGPARLLIIGTYRPADVIVRAHPLKALKQELQARGQCEEIGLRFLTAEEIRQYLQARFGRHRFPAELGRAIYHSTDGNPLFMVNMVDYLVARGMIREVGGQ
jgi:predicted ATPase